MPTLITNFTQLYKIITYLGTYRLDATYLSFYMHCIFDNVNVGIVGSKILRKQAKALKIASREYNIKERTNTLNLRFLPKKLFLKWHTRPKKCCPFFAMSTKWKLDMTSVNLVSLEKNGLSRNICTNWNEIQDQLSVKRANYVKLKATLHRTLLHGSYIRW